MEPDFSNNLAWLERCFTSGREVCYHRSAGVEPVVARPGNTAWRCLEVAQHYLANPIRYRAKGAEFTAAMVLARSAGCTETCSSSAREA